MRQAWPTWPYSAGNLRNVLEVIELEEVSELDSAFCSNMLMLVVEVLSPLSEANGRESFGAERTVVSSAKIAIEPKLHHRFKRLQLSRSGGRGSGCGAAK